MTSPLDRFLPPAADAALPVRGPALATDHPRRVLSLSGGGFLGLYAGICKTKVFKTPHGPASQGDGGLRAVDVALAACAAPAYFPSVRIGRRIYADGGLFAVAPDQVALHELKHFMGVGPDRVSMLSIGTATAQPSRGGGARRHRRGRLAVRRQTGADANLRAAATYAGDDGRPPR